MESIKEATPQRLLLRIPEVATRLGLGRSMIYKMIASGELPVIRIGRAVRISASALQKWVSDHET